MRTIELLAPAKNYEYGCAAVDCGADALYVGAPGFGARVDAAVPVGDIARLCDYAHRFGVRVFVTMNTLVFADELREAERIAREVCRAGADALIVQDTAFLRMDLPPVELHASTQMCTMTPDRARFGATPVFRGSFSSALRPWRRYAGLPTRFRIPGSRRSCTGRFASRTAGSAT